MIRLYGVTYYVSDIIVATFNVYKPKGTMTYHKDKNTCNNRLDNLANGPRRDIARLYNGKEEDKDYSYYSLI